MGDPFGSIAAGVGLADVACRLAKTLYGLVSDLKDASAELHRLRGKLQQLTSVLSHIASIGERYRNSALLASGLPTFKTIRVILEACVGDLRQLQGLLGSPLRQGANVLNRFGKIVKSVFDEKEISQVSLRLESHKASLSTALSVIGRINDLETHDSVQSTNHNVIALRTAFDAKSSQFENQLSNGARVAGEQNNRLNRCLTNLITKTTARFSQMDKGFEDVMQGHASINSTTVRTASKIKDVLETIDRDQGMRHNRLTQSVSGAEHCIKALRSDMSQNSSQTNTRLSQINGGLVDVTDLLKSFQFQLAALGDSNTVTTVFHGSPTQAARSLDYISPHISELISNISAGTQLGSSAKQLRWFASEFERLHDDAVTARAMELKTARGEAGQPQRSSIDQVRMRRKLLKDALRTFCGNRVSQGGLIGREARIASLALLQVVEKTVQVDIPTGTLYIMVGTTATVQQSAQRTWMLRLLFIPDIRFRINGLAATFVNTMDYTTKIAPFLSTFGIQPKKSPIFVHIQAGNISEVQGLFSTQRASVSDRDEFGKSLLAYAIQSYDFDMIKFLLEQGADALDCNRFGEAALIELLKGARTAAEPHVEKKDILKILTLLIRYCDVDVYGVFGIETWSRPRIESMGGVLQFALLGYGSQPGQLFKTIRMLLQHGCDPEDRTTYGATPLLSALSNVPDSGLVSLTNLLLDAGLDPLAVDNRNYGCLHILLGRLSVCNKYGMSSTEAKEYTDLIVNLLSKGCGISLRNDDGYTPFDLALTPTAWVLWCDALREADLDVESLLIDDDDGHDVSYLESDRKARKFLESSVQTVKPKYNVTYVNSKCIVCEQTTICSWTRKHPFDCCESTVIPYSENSPLGWHSFNPDRNVKYFSGNHWAELSWRKHVAYKLWRDGILSSPYEAEMWATGNQDHSNKTHEPSEEVQDSHVQNEAEYTAAMERDYTCEEVYDLGSVDRLGR